MTTRTWEQVFRWIDGFWSGDARRMAAIQRRIAYREHQRGDHRMCWHRGAA